MAQTVIGFFDNKEEAQEAVQKLQNKGISRDRIDVTSNNRGTADVSYSRDRDDDRDNESGITKFFRSLFGSDDDEATRYRTVAEQADTIVTVHTQSLEEAEDAADILDDNGAFDVDERAAEYGYQSSRGDSYTGDRRNTGDLTERSSTGETTIPRIEENLEVGKRTEERGGVRVRSRIVERPVEESIRLREEHVRVERHPVDRPVTSGDLSHIGEREIELTERAEVPVVNKEARVVEEVRLTKDVNERQETIQDSVRSTEIDVEPLSGDARRNRDTADGNTPRYESRNDE